MRPDSDKYYCYQWCGRMRWACVRDATGRDCNWVLVRSSGRIVPGAVGLGAGRNINKHNPASLQRSLFLFLGLYQKGECIPS
jgi:hypothetical protein